MATSATKEQTEEQPERELPPIVQDATLFDSDDDGWIIGEQPDLSIEEAPQQIKKGMVISNGEADDLVAT